MLDVLQPTYVGHEPHTGAKDEPRTKRVARAIRAKEPKMRHCPNFYTKRSRDPCMCSDRDDIMSKSKRHATNVARLKCADMILTRRKVTKR